MGQCDNLIPTRFLAPLDCSKIPAQVQSLCVAIKCIYSTLVYKVTKPETGSLLASLMLKEGGGADPNPTYKKQGLSLLIPVPWVEHESILA